MAVLSRRTLSTPTEQDMSLADESSRKLAQCLNRDNLNNISRISVLDGSQPCETLYVPTEALRLFVDLLTYMGKGDIVTLFPIHAELTTQQAADLINVSRPFLVKLLETGKIPFTKPKKHRRIKFEDLMKYKNQIDSLRDQALDELAALDQEMGLGV
jgi:excisionase family DNA binding protein